MHVWVLHVLCMWRFANWVYLVFRAWDRRHSLASVSASKRKMNGHGREKKWNLTSKIYSLVTAAKWDNNGFLSTLKVCIISHRSNKMTDLSGCSWHVSSCSCGYDRMWRRYFCGYGSQGNCGNYRVSNLVNFISLSPLLKHTVHHFCPVP